MREAKGIKNAKEDNRERNGYAVRFNDQKKLYSLTHPQKRIWYMEKIFSASALHNIGGIVKVKGKINYDLLEKAINIFIKKNEGIRLQMVETNGEVKQFVRLFEEKKLSIFDFGDCENPHEELESFVTTEFEKAFNLYNEELYYFAMFKIDENNTGYIVKLHHIISDGWSINIMTEQICNNYEKLIRNAEIDDCIEDSYIEYIEKEKEYLESQRFIKNKKFWNEKLKALPERVSKYTSDNIQGNRKTYYLDEDKSRKIKKFIKQKKSSINILFITAFLIYKYKTTYQKNVIIGTPVLNRAGRKEKNIFGMFTSTMPFAINIEDDDSIEVTLEKVGKELKRCYFNQKYPYNLLIQDLDIKRVEDRELFNVSINCYSSKPNSQLDGMAIENVELYSGNQIYSMQIIVKDWLDEGSLSLSFDYKIDDYTEEQIEEIYKYINVIIESILKKPDQEICKLKMVNRDEEKYMLEQLNPTQSIYPSDKTICELFEEQVEETPNRIAVSFEDFSLTYRELNYKASQLGGFLKRSGVAKGSVVGIMATHSLEVVIGILGIMKAEGVYLPIDPSLPSDRIKYMLDDSKTSLILNNFDLNSKIDYGVKTIDLRDQEIYEGENREQDVNARYDDLVYIIYTSGSTGTPKGVMIKQQGLTNYIYWAKKMYVKSDIERFALYSSLSFDLTVTSIFTPLVSGGEIVVYHDDGSEFIIHKILEDMKASVIKLTPSHLSLIQDMDNSKRSIKRLIVGGENLKASMAKKVYESFDSEIEIFNEYGPTETVVGCMIHKYNAETDVEGSVPIGIPADNVQIYIVDKHLNLSPIGAIGEICISGDGVAKGYLNKPELTKKRFVANPFESGKIMYRTGDLAKLLKNGKIEYIGREDSQVKIKGYRIELSEIETVLLKYGGIKDVVVTVNEGLDSHKFLSAYIVMSEETSIEGIRNYINNFLPKYMIPTYFIDLDKLPLTINGKVDKNLLPEPKKQYGTADDYQAPENEIEKELVNTVQEILGGDKIGLNDNFYHLGGDSIKAIQIAARMKSKNFKIKVKDILKYPVIKGMALKVKKDYVQPEANELAKGIIERTPIVSWFFHQDFNNIAHWNQSVLLDLKLDISSKELGRIVKELIRHHDMLRVNYDKTKEIMFYNNAHLDREKEGIVIDLSSYSYEQQKREMKKLGEKIKSGFNIEEDILFNIVVFDLGSRGNRMLITAHHLVIDAVSWRIILEDLKSIIFQMRNNKEIELKDKSDSYQKWARQVNRYSNYELKRERRYWDSIISKLDSFSQPKDIDKELLRFSNTIERSLNKKETESLLGAANIAYGTKTNELLIMAMAFTWAKLTGDNKVIIELESHGRHDYLTEDVDVSRTVGWFTSIYPVVLEIREDEVVSRIKALKEQLRSILNDGFDFSILRYLSKKLDVGTKKYIRFNYIGDITNSFDSEDVFSLAHEECGAEYSMENHMTSKLDINCIIKRGELNVYVTYSTERFDKEYITEFINKYIDQIKSLIKHCSNKKDKEFTPSDFGLDNISQESLDSLFEIS
ncbi:amino acid adenylation domain-containing protein [Wukongibacter sp. M2B1]|uniref:amino acid adenylation domain-containing protein n=1 Tax=Wukongibacter sp. M2B1 TaxID=3088895 RepID=UPI003D7A2F64